MKNLYYKFRGWLAIQLAQLAGLVGAVTFIGELKLDVIRRDGTMKPLGVVSRRVVTTEFAKAIASALDDDASDAKTRFPSYKYHGFGTGTTGAAVGDTTLETEITDGTPLRGTGTQVNNGDGTYTSVGTVTFAGTHAITEHGLFSNAYGSDDELMDRHTFTAVNVVAGDSIQATYTLTATAGG